MTENRYDDELLSAIIDGEATAESIAAVEADPAAQQRLLNMAAGVELVARPVPSATPERKAQSIAAAMAAVTPASPEVTSLSAARHNRDEAKKNRPTGWLIAAAAAVLLFILGIPLLLNTGTVETATDAAAEASDVAPDEVDTDTAGADSSDDEAMEDEEEEQATEDAANVVAEVEEEAMEDEEEAMEDEEEAMEDEEEAMEDEEEAMEDEESPAAQSAAAPEFIDGDVEVVSSVEDLELLITNATIVPELSRDDIDAFESSLARSNDVSSEVLATEINPECFANGVNIENATPYSVVILDPFAGGPMLIIVEFADDGTSRLLDAQTCAVLG